MQKRLVAQSSFQTFGSLSLALSLALLRRGSAREAEAVLQQAQILADASSCSTLAANIAGGMAEVAISSNSLETAAEQLTIATLHWDTVSRFLVLISDSILTRLRSSTRWTGPDSTSCEQPCQRSRTNSRKPGTYFEAAWTGFRKAKLRPH